MMTDEDILNLKVKYIGEDALLSLQDEKVNQNK